MTTPRFTVAIVGGGIAGLTLAIALGRYPDIQVHLYEAVHQFGELGVGLTFIPRAWDIFEKLGVDGELLKYTTQKPSREECTVTIKRKSDQQKGFVYYNNIVTGKTMSFHRCDCQAALLAKLPQNCNVLLTRRLASYNQEGSDIELRFQDGSMARCNVLIGADGYRSTVRRCFLQERASLATSETEKEEILNAIEAPWTGAVVYRGVISTDELRASNPDHPSLKNNDGQVMYTGLNRFIITYPIQQGKLINWAAVDFRHDLENTKYDGPASSPSSVEEVISLFGNFESDAWTLFKLLSKVTKWAIHSVRPMETFIHKNVALAGDAAHAMAPYLGVGAGQAVEDAYILAAVLGHPKTTRETLGRALQIYDKVRRPVALKARDNSRKCGQYVTLRMDGVNFNGRTDQRELREDLQRLGEIYQDKMTEIYRGLADQTCEEAMRMVE